MPPQGTHRPHVGLYLNTPLLCIMTQKHDTVLDLNTTNMKCLDTMEVFYRTLQVTSYLFFLLSNVLYFPYGNYDSLK